MKLKLLKRKVKILVSALTKGYYASLTIHPWQKPIALWHYEKLVINLGLMTFFFRRVRDYMSDSMIHLGHKNSVTVPILNYIKTITWPTALSVVVRGPDAKAKVHVFNYKKANALSVDAFSHTMAPSESSARDYRMKEEDLIDISDDFASLVKSTKSKKSKKVKKGKK